MEKLYVKIAEKRKEIFMYESLCREIAEKRKSISINYFVNKEIRFADIFDDDTYFYMGSKNWGAKVSDFDPKFRFKRDWLSKRSISGKWCLDFSPVEKYDIVDIARSDGLRKIILITNVSLTGIYGVLIDFGIMGDLIKEKVIGEGKVDVKKKDEIKKNDIKIKLPDLSNGESILIKQLLKKYGKDKISEFVKIIELNES